MESAMMESDDDDTDFIGFSPVKHEENPTDQLSATDIEQANAMARQLHVFKPGINFVSGAKLEVLDARDNKWYQCKVVQVDWGELDILVHYERWSVRFDEWLKMDSTRIRSLTQSKEKLKPAFKVGEKVLGYWAPDSKYYVCQIKKHNSEDFYEVQFYDGYTRSLRSSQLKKITNPKQYSGIDAKKSPKILKQVPVVTAEPVSPSAPEMLVGEPETSTQMRRRSESTVLYSPPASPTSSIAPKVMENPDAVELLPDYLNPKRNIFNVEILDEKRKTKRKPDVEELFKSRKKRKFDEMDESCTPEPKMKTPGCTKSKLKREHIFEDSEKSRTPESPSIPTSEGMPSKNLNYFEVGIGHGWKKVCNRRLHGIWTGKWDVYFVTPEKRKIRTRQELIKYCSDHATRIKPCELNFSVRSAKSKYDEENQTKDDCLRFKQDSLSDEDDLASMQERDAVDEVAIDDNDEDYEEEEDDDGRDDLMDSSDDESDDESFDGNKKIPLRDIVKKRQSSSSESELETSPEKQSVSNVSLNQLSEDTNPNLAKSPQDSSIYIKKEEDLSPSVGTKLSIPRQRNFKKDAKIPGLLEVSPSSESSHKCPSKTCEKSFRKENLLQMHMKHYHPELLKKRSMQAPNVADLAYARTVGDHLDVASLSPSSHSLPSVDFMVPDKKNEPPRKSRLGEGKKSTERKSQGRPPKENKKEISKTIQAVASDSDDGNDGNMLNDLQEEEEIVNMRKVAGFKNDSDSFLKSKLSKKKLKERVISTSSRRRSRKSGSEVQPDAIECQEEDNMDSLLDTQSDYQDAIIHCGCKSQEEDGLMLQCDVCLTWQHGGCYNIESEEQVPEKYICSLCENPQGQRSSMRFRHHQEWLKEGKLPRFSFSTSKPNTKLESCLRRGHELSANVLQLSQLIYSLRLKLNISKEADHPKFVMWHKKWKDPVDVGVDDESKYSEDKLNQQISENQISPVQHFMQTFNQPVTHIGTPEAFINPNFKSELPSFVPLAPHSESHDEIISSEVLDSKEFGVNTIPKDELLRDSVTENEHAFKSEAFSEKHELDTTLSEELKPDAISEQLKKEFPMGKQIETTFDNKHDPNVHIEDEIVDSSVIKLGETEEKKQKRSDLIEHDENESVFKLQPLDTKIVDIVPIDIVESKMKEIFIKKTNNHDIKDNTFSEVANKEEILDESLQVSTPTEESMPDKPFNLKLDMDTTTIQKIEHEDVEMVKEDLDKKIDKPEYTSAKGTEGTQDSLEDTEDFDLAFRDLGASGETSINVGLADLLSSHPDLEQLVDVAARSLPLPLPSLVQNPISVTSAPIIPKNERIEPINCKLNLLKHIEQIQDKVFERFDLIEEEIKELEAEMGLTSEISREEEQLLNSNEGEDRDAITLQARSLVQMTLKDIDTVKKLSEFSEPK